MRPDNDLSHTFLDQPISKNLLLVVGTFLGGILAQIKDHDWRNQSLVLEKIVTHKKWILAKYNIFES